MVIVRLLRNTFPVIARNAFSRQGSLERIDFYKPRFAPKDSKMTFSTPFLKKGQMDRAGERISD
jgi:hypothetical protein